MDDYLAGLDEPARAAFERIRSVAAGLAPDAEQGLSHGLAALRLRGKPLPGFKAAKDHLAVFPFSPAAVDVVRDLVRQRMGEIG
ncbi:hypothetical protein [Lentzea sp. NPDC003310]|uniref:iron chaperone n=1 Tax=Lentzea sp. NPDC003310 TaxID=3154447 RepID=UPI0033ACF38B